MSALPAQVAATQIVGAPILFRTRRLSASCLLLTAFCLLLSACTPADRFADATAQADQYHRDAQATGTARAIEFESDLNNVRATDGARQATADAQETQSMQATVDAQATQNVQATQNMVATQQASRDQTATATALVAAATQTQRAVGTATAQAERQASETAMPVQTQTVLHLQQQQANANRDNATALAIALLAVVAVCVAIYLLFIAGRTRVRNDAKRGAVLPYGPNGNPLVMADNGRGVTIINPLANASAITRLDGCGAVIADELPAETRLQAFRHYLDVLIHQAQHNPFPPVPGQPEHTERWRIGALENEKRTGALPAAVGARLDFSRSPGLPSPTHSLPAEAPWSLVETHWRGGSLPIGLGPRGLLQADPELNAHLLIAGATGAGKSRYLLKPIIAGALADGWQVVAFDRTGLHFNLFRAHQNFHLVTLDDPVQLAGHVDRLHVEVNRRFKTIAALGLETWRGTGGAQGPRILVVVDDFSILSDMLDSAERRSLWLAVRRLVADSRKSGIHLALVVQSPTWQSIDLGIRRNCTPITLRVNDADASRVILNAPGAEALPERRFLALLPALTPGVAFAPDDDQLSDFVEARRAPALPEPEWLAGPLSAPTPDEIELLAERIRPLWEQGSSKRAMARAAGKDYAGSFAGKVDQAIALLELAAVATTADSAGRDAVALSREE